MIAFKMQRPIANMGKSILKDKNPAGSKPMFASKISPVNHADRVAAMAVKYTARFPFALNIKAAIHAENAEKIKITKRNPSILSAPKSRSAGLI